jgi:hypothetical protein
MSRAAADADLETIERLTAITPEVKRLLKEARIAIESVYLPAEDKDDVADSLLRLARELSSANRHPERMMRYWTRINDLAPTVAHQLAKSEDIQRLSLCWGDCIQPKGGFLNESTARQFVESLDDPEIRTALKWFYAQIVQMSIFKGDRPEGTFDLLYFYKVLAWLFSTPYVEVRLASPRSTDSWQLASGG